MVKVFLPELILEESSHSSILDWSFSTFSKTFQRLGLKTFLYPKRGRDEKPRWPRKRSPWATFFVFLSLTMKIPPFTVRLVVIHCNLRLTNDSRPRPDIAWKSSLAYVNVSMCLELVAKRQRKVCSSLNKSIGFDNLDMPAPPRG